MRLCALILALCLPLSAFATSASASDIKVLTWNVYMLPWPIKDSMQKERSKAIAASLSQTDYDIMFFQEAFSKGFRRTMLKQVSKAYPYSTYLGADGKLKHVFGSGLLIMSRRPFRILDHVYYKTCSGSDCFAAKGSILIETQLENGRTVQFATTHLQSIIPQGAKRMVQLAQVKGMLSAHKKHGIPQIFLGDLNIDPAQPEMEKGLALLNLKNAELLGPIRYTSGLASDCYKTDRGLSWIDHAWASNDGTVGSIAMTVRRETFQHGPFTCPDSDHHAVEVRARLN
jgi:endonuclease/exonuclease/phosphatase family metal-dependent hydrolase